MKLIYSTINFSKLNIYLTTDEFVFIKGFSKNSAFQPSDYFIQHIESLFNMYAIKGRYGHLVFQLSDGVYFWNSVN